jgi:hypothetical protein
MATRAQIIEEAWILLNGMAVQWYPFGQRTFRIRSANAPSQAW